MTAVEPIPPRYNIRPGDGIPSIRNVNDDSIETLEWGPLPGWVDDPNEWPTLYNARSETAHEKPAFRSAFEERRCLVPADGFYEWAGDRGSKRPHRIEHVDGAPFAFAGLWESWSDNGNERLTVTILTTEPNEVVAPIHDRMPVILEPEDEDMWLEADDTEDLRSALDPYPDELTEAYEISTKVNDPSYDAPDVMEPLDHDQSGFRDFL